MNNRTADLVGDRVVQLGNGARVPVDLASRRRPPYEHPYRHLTAGCLGRPLRPQVRARPAVHLRHGQARRPGRLHQRRCARDDRAADRLRGDQPSVAPVPIRFGEAIPIAELGLAVDAASVWVLSGGGHHVYGHHHDLVEASSDHRDGHEVMTSCGILTLSMSYSRRAARVTAARAAGGTIRGLSRSRKCGRQRAPGLRNGRPRGLAGEWRCHSRAARIHGQPEGGRRGVFHRLRGARAGS